MAKMTRKQGLTSRDFADLRDLELIHHELCNYGEQYDHYENKYSYECFNDGYSYKTPPTLNQAIKRQTKTKKSKTLINQNKPERRPEHSPSKKAGRVIKASTRQTGKSAKVDKSRKAMSPGKRESSSGRIYYEYRKNRTDVWGGI